MRQQAFARERFLDRLRRTGRDDHARVAAGTGVFRADRFDDHEARRVVLELFRDGFAHPGFGLATAALFVRVRDIDLDSSPRQVRGQRTSPRRPPSRMAADRRLAGVHLDRLRDGPRFVRELVQREPELARVDALRSFPKQSLTEHVELLTQRRVLALDGGELLLQGRDDRSRGGEVFDRVGRARQRHSTDRDARPASRVYRRPADHAGARRSYQRRRRVRARSTPDNSKPRSCVRISTG